MRKGRDGPRIYLASAGRKGSAIERDTSMISFVSSHQSVIKTLADCRVPSLKEINRK
jgi:hypothetical protein